MKVSLVVASGVHQGKVVPVAGPQFLVGRDPQCQLRPASQAISKRHCGVLVRDGKVYVRDYGSTNGTTVNGEVVRDAEVAVEDGASLKIGPLDFLVRLDPAAAPVGTTPAPAADPAGAAALAAVRAVARPAGTRDSTPAPAAKAGPDGGEPREAPAAKPAATPAAPAGSDDEIAAMLLGMDDDGTGEVPDGSTVMDIPAGLAGQAAGGKPDEKGKKPTVSREDMTNAATDILRKMMRRPK